MLLPFGPARTALPRLRSQLALERPRQLLDEAPARRCRQRCAALDGRDNGDLRDRRLPATHQSKHQQACVVTFDVDGQPRHVTVPEIRPGLRARQLSSDKRREGGQRLEYVVERRLDLLVGTDTGTRRHAPRQCRTVACV